MIEHLQLKTKIALLMGTALLGMLSLVLFSALGVRNDLIDGRKALIRSVLEGVHATVGDYQA